MDTQSSTRSEEKNCERNCNDENVSSNLSVGSNSENMKLSDEADLSSALSVGSNPEDADNRKLSKDNSNLSFDSGDGSINCGVSIPQLCGNLGDVVSTADVNAVDDSLQAELDELSFDTNLLDDDDDDDNDGKEDSSAINSMHNSTEKIDVYDEDSKDSEHNKQCAGQVVEKEMNKTETKNEPQSLETSMIDVDIVKTLLYLVDDTCAYDEIGKWNFRVIDKRLYQHTYIPLPRERREIEELAKLYVKPNQTKDALYQYFSPQLDEPSNVLLKREYAICSIVKEPNQKRDQYKDQLSEIVLLSHGFFIAPINFSSQLIRSRLLQQESSHIKDIKKIFSKSVSFLFGKRKRYESCHSILSILSVNKMDPMNVLGTNDLLYPFTIQVKTDEDKTIKYEVYSLSQERQNAWVKAFETSISYNAECSKVLYDKKVSSDQSAKTKQKNSKLSNLITSIDPNLSGFLERGEKLAQIDSKSSALKEAAKNYHDNARQLKERLEKQHKGWFSR